MTGTLLTTLAAAATMVLTVGGGTVITGPAHVIDGDTVIVGGTVVRLKGVDAAELGTPRGENARRMMAAIVTGTLTCRLTGEKTWGREVGYCSTADGVDINQAIIASCVGVPEVRQPLCAVRAGRMRWRRRCARPIA